MILFIRLVHFAGNASNYSPRARFRKYILGYPYPFDRHDWVVDRCGKKVKYVIDFYDVGSKAGDKYRFIRQDVRPAMNR